MHKLMCRLTADERGAIVFVPMVFSLLERGYVLWHMPERSPLEKIAARALISNRVVTGLGIFGVMTAIMLIGVAVPAVQNAVADWWHVLVAGAIYFGIAAFDDWRVRGRKFAERPSRAVTRGCFRSCTYTRYADFL